MQPPPARLLAMKVAVIGASRGVGRHIAERALARGYDVTAAMRNPAALELRHERLRTVTCDALDSASVSAAISGQDVVLCAIGDNSRGPTTLYSSAAANVLAGMRQHSVRRLVFLSNFGVLDETASDFIGSLLLLLARRVIRHTLADHRRALDAIRSSGVEWIAVRPMALSNSPRTGRYRVDRTGLPRNGRSIGRADIADFMLSQAHDDSYLRQVPAVAY
jgi:putative NADH-flavin reductase